MNCAENMNRIKYVQGRIPMQAMNVVCRVTKTWQLPRRYTCVWWPTVYISGWKTCLWSRERMSSFFTAVRRRCRWRLGLGELQLRDMHAVSWHDRPTFIINISLSLTPALCLFEASEEVHIRCNYAGASPRAGLGWTCPPHLCQRSFLRLMQIRWVFTLQEGVGVSQLP